MGPGVCLVSGISYNAYNALYLMNPRNSYRTNKWMSKSYFCPLFLKWSCALFHRSCWWTDEDLGKGGVLPQAWGEVRTECGIDQGRSISFTGKDTTFSPGGQSLSVCVSLWGPHLKGAPTNLCVWRSDGDVEVSRKHVVCGKPIACWRREDS